MASVIATSFAHGRLEKDNELVQSVIDEAMKRQRTCVFCTKTYRQFENIGAWQCAMHTHPYDQDRKVYPCCGTNNKGCQGCDHSDIETPRYPDSTTTEPFLRGVPAFQLCEGNLKELAGVFKEAIHYPPNYAEQRRTLGDLTKIYIYRQCLYGQPSETRYGH